ncbi:hypothetical protein I302_101319 [Kwoniella bestiolae CBS 10118]|uniref:Zn(2)-C6 fungal-type domain-containing protein n=1 Tax=Kwoniella bestiolae CBS 10118 TaxID=1296100 RepID=A0AAJ8K1M0_9TREE
MSHTVSTQNQWSPVSRAGELDGGGDPSSSSPPLTKSTKRTRTGSRKDVANKNRCINACNRCKLKKLKCYRTEESSGNCAACEKSSEACVFEDIVMRPGYAKYIIALEDRCAKLEKALFDIMPNHPELSDHFVSSGPEITFRLSSSSQAEGSSYSTSGPYETRTFAQSRGALSGLLHSCLPFKPSSHSHPTDLGSVMQPTSPIDTPANPNPAIPSIDIANKLINTVYSHLQCRYPFLDWGQISKWHADRDKLLHTKITAPYEDQIAAFFLWGIYAIGIQLEPASGLDSSQSYFEQAWKYSDTVTTPHDLMTARILLLTTFFAFRATSGLSLWLLGGLAMRLCVEIGVYKKDPIVNDHLEDQWKKRIFWSAYTFDRLISHASGRPVSIADEVIDVDMPADVDTTVADPQVIKLALASQGGISDRLTNMTSAIMSIKMYRIRSRIHAALPALRNSKTSRELTVGFLKELEEWRQNIPRQEKDTAIPMQAEDRFRWRYFLCVLLALRPSIIKASPNDPTLGLCATAAAEACELDRTVHKGPATRQTTISVCHTLLCGTTLLYCLHISPTVISKKVSSRAIRACSSTLAVYSQLFNEARPFSEMFEYMADELLAEVTLRGESADIVIEVITSMFDGNFEPLARLYDSLKNQTSDDRTTSDEIVANPPTDLVVAATMNSEQPTEPTQLVSTGLTPFLGFSSRDELGQLMTGNASETTNGPPISGDGLNLDWLNLDNALWEYMT